MREVENAWVPMPDGVRLALSLWLPDGADPAPVVLESIPYRKRDSTRAYARHWGRQLTERGIAYARLDIRGSGDSEGLLADEYLPREQADAAEVIGWLAAQPWCNGKVGMRGVSWGGFAALQTAALAPPALKAVMPICASDRRYTDDAHFVGGAFALTGMKWATSFKLVMAGPPDPEISGPGWEQAWFARLEASPAIAAAWLGRQREDAYWRQGSVGFEPGRIRCPVYLVGGWADPYNETIARLLQSLDVPVKALIGPWGHGYPSPATPGPGLAWIDEETRWWRCWLADEPTGVMEGPRVWAYLPDRAPSEAPGEDIPGRWVGETAWPPPGAPWELRLDPRGALVAEAPAAVAELRGDPAVGLATPEWCPFGAPQYAQEQSADDARSLVFETAPLEAAVDLLGAPVVRLRLAASAPVAMVAARLTEVAPDGRSWLISYGLLNLTHRTGHDAPSPLTPGAPFELELPLQLTARRVAAGRRLRLALSQGLWPLVWPAPAAVTLSLDLAGCGLRLPVRAPRTSEPPFPMASEPGAWGSPQSAPRIAWQVLPEGEVVFEEVSPATTATVRGVETRVERSGADVSAMARADDPNAGFWRTRQSVRYARGDWDCGLEAQVELTSTPAAFHLKERLIARLRGEVVFDREDTAEIPRDLM